MNQFTLKFKKIGLSLTKWQNNVSPKVELWIDKYKIVKVGCVLGIAVNSYFIYDGFLTTVVLRKVQKDVADKKEVFYRRVDSKRELVLALMQELEGAKPKQAQLQQNAVKQ